MNDRFKFRIWDKKLKKLAKWNDNPYHNMEIMNYICVENPVTDWKHEDYILMQSTGLKDKNGKLIYEGDILKDKYGALHPISWNVKGFYEADTFAVAGFYNAIQEDMEVIGNIYENPELLESEG